MAIKSASVATRKLSKALGFIENNIDGLGVTVRTWGHPLKWRHASCLLDRTVHGEKRDQYLKRSELCSALADRGEYEYAVAYAPKIPGASKTSFAVKCSLCGKGHNWCVFYRDAKTGAYLGHSGIPCFTQVVENTSTSAAEAVIETAKREQRRADKMRATMERINDFKADFPGLYEHRDTLSKPEENPYSLLWTIVLNRLADAKGVNEQWLKDCHEGKLDNGRMYWDARQRRWTREVLYKRVPLWLQWASKLAGRGLTVLLSESHKRSYQEEQSSIFHRDPPERLKNNDDLAPTGVGVNTNTPPSSQPTIGDASKADPDLISDDEVLHMARRLRTDGPPWFNSSYVIRDALEGRTAGITKRQRQWLKQSYEKHLN